MEVILEQPGYTGSVKYSDYYSGMDITANYIFACIQLHLVNTKHCEKLCWNTWHTTANHIHHSIINRPGVAGAVLQSPPLLIN